MKYLDDLLHWITERENIRVKKTFELTPPPWTDDPIIANNRWCNVYREDDKVTKWIMEKWIPHQRSIHDQNLPIALCIARLVNWPDTLEQLGYPEHGWTPVYRQHFLDTFANRRKMGQKSWTGAYMVTGGFSAGGETKEVIIARVLDGASDKCDGFIIDRPKRLSEAAMILSTPGIGPFLVAQVIADLKHTGHLRHAIDYMDWCAPGPGSMMGLNFIHDRPRAQSIGGKQFIEEVNEIQRFIADNLKLELCAQNTQNCLCELSKYVRAKYFNERLKNSYIPKEQP
jgi:hypothetical protein